MENTIVSIKEKISQIIIEEMSIQEKMVFDDDILIIEDLGFDSVQLMSFIVQIESVFKIEFDDADILFDRYNRFGDLCVMVKDLLEKKGEES